VADVPGRFEPRPPRDQLPGRGRRPERDGLQRQLSALAAWAADVRQRRALARFLDSFRSRASGWTKPPSQGRGLALLGLARSFSRFGDRGVGVQVGGKMFALCSLDAEPPLQLIVKCDPELAVHLRSAYPAISPGYPPEQAHWNTLTLTARLRSE